MKWFIDLSTRTKLLLSFGLGIILLIVVIMFSIKGIARVEDREKETVKHEFANTTDLLTLMSYENEVRVGLLSMMAVNDETGRGKWHQLIKERSSQIGKLMYRLTERNKDTPEDQSMLNELSDIRGAFTQTRDNEIVPLIYDKKIDQARRLAMGIQAERYEKMKAITTELLKMENERVKLHLSESEQETARTKSIFYTAGVIAIVASIIMVFFWNSIIARPLKELSETAEKVSSGDLTVSFPLNGRLDEVGVLMRIFRTMIERMQRQTRDISESVSVLASSSNEIASTTAQLAAGTEQTAIAVTETTTTVEEVKQTVNMASEKAKNVSAVAQNAVQFSQNGMRLVGETIDGINNIKSQMDYIAETIVKLSEHSQAIGEIIAAVDDIAEQSNLLAVNAAIEATKVGEYGKGFIVVAQEIKSLAEQSKQATRQVRIILNDIQKSNTAAVMATEKGAKAVEAVVKQSSNTGNAIQELSKGITEASQSAIQIAASSQQQLIGMDQVALAMNNIKQATTQNAASTRQVELTMRTLQEVGQRLKTLVDYYRVS
ncbi:MAG: methyl-accepting chemotaxis protein [Nitrospirae bacterium]|nr:methyl-accepting chemotaxis protein [Nitrospirota bacterium]